MRHLYVIVNPNGVGIAPRATQLNAARGDTIVRAARTVVAATLAIATLAIAAIASVSPLGAQQASRTKSPTPPATPAAPATGATVVDNDSYNLSAATVLRDAPSSAAIGQLQKTANVQVIAHDRGWSRVRIDAWVPDSVLVPADTAFRSNLSAADLRADPAAARGKMVMWNVEFLAMQTADPLRQGLADEEPYMLARGPNSENALLYLVVPPSLMGTARALQPLSRITVTARVRDGRSDPVGIPILDIQTLRRIR